MKKVGLVLALLVAVAPLAAQKRDRIIERIVVKVNGEIFTQTDLEQLQIEALRKENPKLGNVDLQNDATLKAALETVTPDILVSAVDELLLVQHGREQGYNLGDEQFKNVLEQVKKDNKLNDEQLKVALAQEGLTMESYRSMMERQMIVGTVQRQEIMQKATLTDEEARQYYDGHQKDFMKPATVTLREMMVTVPTETRDGQDVFNAAVDEAAKKKMDDAIARLKKGDDFATVAAEMSDSGSKANGGLIGVVNLDQMNPTLRDMIAKLKPGEFTESTRVKGGYQIFKVDARSAEEVEAFDKVRDKISQKVYAERLEGETQKFLSKLRETALIEWKDDAYKTLYDKGVAARAGKQ
ncbi:MAG TPA: peptidylprolyl isomerase [Vicinamibacterales bacterium]|nr:peptidylprolyl isomerase [Vicinamibacterales bacterium]